MQTQPTPLSRSEFNRLANREIAECIGFCRGIVCDGAITEGELVGLKKFFMQAEHLQEHPMLSLVYEQLECAKANDNNLDPLLSLLDSLVGQETETQLGEIRQSTSLPFDTPVPTVVFRDAYFVLTGDFTFATRSEFFERISGLGGLKAERVTKKCNYLIVGAYATGSWKQSSFGRKIEHAQRLKSGGANIKILSEESFFSQLGHQESVTY